MDEVLCRIDPTVMPRYVKSSPLYASYSHLKSFCNHRDITQKIKAILSYCNISLHLDIIRTMTSQLQEPK